MKKKGVRSTRFLSRPEYRPSERDKKEQERLIGELFAEGYKQAIGITLEHSRPGDDPPDWLFSYQGLKIGVEMFMLDQFYEPRALLNDLEDNIYSEFQRRGASERYGGVGICLLALIDSGLAGKVRAGWRKTGIRGNPKIVFASELVDLFVQHVPSRDSIPGNGRLISVEPRLYPAVSALTERIHVFKYRGDDPRRTDGQAAPLVISHSGYTMPSADEIQEDIKQQIVKKIKDRPSWKAIDVDHSVLVAHNIPRVEVKEVCFLKEWNDRLARAASSTRLLQVFNEFWFVTPFDVVEDGKIILRKAQPICGKQLSQRSTQT